MTAHPSAQDIVALYERHAADYDRQRQRGDMERSWLERFRVLMPGPCLLDIGCGVGEPIARHFIAAGCKVTGIDSAAGMIARCRTRFPDHTWLQADMRDLALGRVFDGLIAWDSFFHLPPESQRRMFSVFARHARKGSPLLFTSGPRAGEAIGSWQGAPLYHASLDPQDYRDLFAASGFREVAHVAEDPQCGGHSVWLARADPATP